MLLFLSLALLVFYGRAGSAGSVRFCLSLPYSLCLSAYHWQCRSAVLLVVLFLPLWCCFLLLCCSDIYFAFSWCLPPVANVVAWAPVGTLMPSSRVPLCGIGTLRPSPPSMTIYAPPVLCVCLLLVCMCVLDNVRMLLGHVHVCLPTCLVCKCV